MIESRDRTSQYSMLHLSLYRPSATRDICYRGGNRNHWSDQAKSAPIDATQLDIDIGSAPEGSRTQEPAQEC